MSSLNEGWVVCMCRAAAEQADAVIRDKFAPALDASIVRLQNLMEGLCHDLRKSEAKRDAKAGEHHQQLTGSKPHRLASLCGCKGEHGLLHSWTPHGLLDFTSGAVVICCLGPASA